MAGGTKAKKYIDSDGKVNKALSSQRSIRQMLTSCLMVDDSP